MKEKTPYDLPTTKDILIVEGVVVGAAAFTYYITKGIIKSTVGGYKWAKKTAENKKRKEFFKNWDGVFWEIGKNPHLPLKEYIFYDWDSCLKTYNKNCNEFGKQFFNFIYRHDTKIGLFSIYRVDPSGDGFIPFSEHK
jgi:hypothetical protein